MRLFNNLFKRKSKRIDEKTLNSMGIKTAKIDRVEVDGINPVETETKWKKWRVLYNDTGEVVDIDPNDEKDMDEFWDSERPKTILGFSD